ncbi:MAG: cellulase family glycosylhydrolase [Spirochaetes bacterium]|nr:cellulase family glycosylhydrolase [Spirochaetota bacterium]
MIRIDGPRLVDGQGGTLILRGANIGGSSKIPSRPSLPTGIREGFYDHRGVSFVDRPFPLADAEDHFRRLRDWGMRFNRFMVTWEAVEHRGPGEYDREYLDYLEAVLARGAALGLRFVVDFHQDVWSRFTGGDGAPGWTLELAGLNPRTLHAAGAAVLHCELGGRMPILLWSTNHWKLGAATMATLFFGGDAFAPDLRVGAASIQSFLQERYAGFVREVSTRLARIDAVAGYDIMNEPPAGFIGYPDLASDRFMFLRNGSTPSPFDGIAAGSGFAREVPIYRQTLLGLLRVGRCTINQEGASAWIPGSVCPWLRHGVWTDRAGNPVLLRPDYFAAVGGRRVSFGSDFLRPFLARIGREIHAVDPGALLFIEDSPQRRELRWSAADGANAVHAAHWYDVLTMFRKRFTPWMYVDGRTLRPAFGRAGVRRSFRRQIGAIPKAAAEELGGIPSFVGEFGLPFGSSRGVAFRARDEANRAGGLEAYYDALDFNLLGATLWNYTADNTLEGGDGWNDEDFSVYCRGHGDAGMTGDAGTVGDGGRAVAGFCRPYASRVPGVPLGMRYEPGRRRFTLVYRGDPAAYGDVEVFVPPNLARCGLDVQVSDGSWRHDAESRTLFATPDPGRPVHEIVVEFPRPTPSRRPGARSSR